MAETLADKLAELEVLPSVGCCKVPLVLDLDPEAGEVLLRLLANKEISIRRIHDVMKQCSIAIGTDSMYKHRNQRCSCFE